jgi:hypothetical protein
MSEHAIIAEASEGGFVVGVNADADDSMTCQKTAAYAQVLAQSSDIAVTAKQHQDTNNYPFKCAFSPDGLCVLTATTGDNLLRLYNTPPIPPKEQPQSQSQPHSHSHSWTTMLQAKENDAVRDYAWYPHMNSNDPASCFFASTSR